MPGWAKALISIAIVVVLLVIGAVAVGVFVVVRNKDAWLARGKAVAEEGTNFGRGTDNQGCVDEALSRYKKEPGFTSILSNTIFMQTCLDASKPTPGFCDDVPRASEFMKSAQWRLQQCRSVGLQRDQNCQSLFAPVQQYCELKYHQPREVNSNSE